MARDYPPPDVLMQGDRPLTAYTLPAKLPPRSGWYIFPIFLHLILYQYYRHRIMGERGDVGRANGIVARSERGGTQVASSVDGSDLPPLIFVCFPTLVIL